MAPTSIPYDAPGGYRGHKGDQVGVAAETRPGALVISLDFEQHWGMRDHVAPGDPLRRSGRHPPDRGRSAALFEERGIRSTWATVGFLFVSTGAELAASLPSIRPSYDDERFDPYRQAVGVDEEHGPRAPGRITRPPAGPLPGQEVASHTFSHYYCLEDGQVEAEFRADLAAARSVAAAGGLDVTSLVLRATSGTPGMRGGGRRRVHLLPGPPAVTWAPGPGQRGPGPGGRAARLVDSYVGTSPPPTFAWDGLVRQDGLCDVPASAFLRPYTPGRRRLDPLRLRRLTSGMRDAARRRRIFHLWWHPTTSPATPGELRFPRTSARRVRPPRPRRGDALDVHAGRGRSGPPGESHRRRGLDHRTGHRIGATGQHDRTTTNALASDAHS